MYPIMNLNQMQAEDVARAERLRDSRYDWRGKKMGSARLARLYEVAGWKEYALRGAARGCNTGPTPRGNGSCKPGTSAICAYVRFVPGGGP